MKPFESVNTIYEKMDDDSLKKTMSEISEEIDTLFRSKWDQDIYQWLRLHLATAKKELEKRDLQK